MVSSLLFSNLFQNRWDKHFLQENELVNTISIQTPPCLDHPARIWTHDRIHFTPFLYWYRKRAEMHCRERAGIYCWKRERKQLKEQKRRRQANFPIISEVRSDTSILSDQILIIPAQERLDPLSHIPILSSVPSLFSVPILSVPSSFSVL